MAASQIWSAHSPQRRSRAAWETLDEVDDLGFAVSLPPNDLDGFNTRHSFGRSEVLNRRPVSPNRPYSPKRRSPTIPRARVSPKQHAHYWLDEPVSSPPRPYLDDAPSFLGPAPLEEVDWRRTPGLAHAWEKHHVISWLYDVGLSDVVANFRAQKLEGKDVLQLTPKNAKEKLKLNDQIAIMRVLEAVMPLKEEWKAARQAQGLSVKLTPKEPDRPKKLVAELHVLIHGVAMLPPGAAGAYVLLELGDHVAKSSFVPVESHYYQDHSYHSYPAWPSSGAGFVHRPTETYSLWPAEEAAMDGGWPQTFKLTVDEDMAKDKEKKYGKVVINVVAWFPQVGELSLGQLDVPVPRNKTQSCRMRFESPLKAELHWKGYGETASPDADAWEVEERPILLPPGGGSYGGQASWSGW